MRKETRTICYDEELHIEAYHFEGIAQPFPNHFHDYYVIGFIESGTRRLSCKNQDYTITSGDILLFNPDDNHGCSQCDDKALDYRALNIPKEVMLSLAEEITGEKKLPHFAENVVTNGELTNLLYTLHSMIMEDSKEFKKEVFPTPLEERLFYGFPQDFISKDHSKEDALLLLISELISQYGQPFDAHIPKCREEIALACAFMEIHYEEPITLEALCECSGLSKSTLLRAFTKAKGVTPYRYLQAVRINKAKNLLEVGVSPIDVSLQTGFSDQSHFSHSFHTFIGLSPAAYGRIFKR